MTKRFHGIVLEAEIHGRVVITVTFPEPITDERLLPTVSVTETASEEKRQ